MSQTPATSSLLDLLRRPGAVAAALLAITVLAFSESLFFVLAKALGPASLQAGEVAVPALLAVLVALEAALWLKRDSWGRALVERPQWLWPLLGLQLFTFAITRIGVSLDTALFILAKSTFAYG